MDTFENNEFTIEPEQEQPQAEAPTPEPQPTAYHGTGAGRKESPYANSPYESAPIPDPQPRYTYEDPAPRKQPKPHKPHSGKKTTGRKIIAVVAALAVVAGSCGLTATLINRHWQQREDAMTAAFADQINGLQDQIDSLPATTGSNTVVIPEDGSAMTPSQLYAARANSIVAINSTVQTASYYGVSEGTSAGSGFILTEDGYIITNYHVVEDATSIQVVTYDGTEYDARLVGYDSSNDLAVLDIEAEGLSTAPLGDSADLNIGDMVVAIGNPLGTLAATQTVGYVSGIDREVSTGGLTTISMIQTDAAINPGNSGGPLFNMQGEVIGITTAKYSGTTNSGATIEGIGFAIPIDDVANLINDLIDYGYVTGAYLGVSVQNTDEDAAAQFGIPTGAYVVTVEDGYCAKEAGIQPKDIIIALGDYEVSNVTDLTRALRNFSAGDTTTVKLIRSGKEMTLEITLDERPNTTEETTAETTPQQESQMPSQGGNYDDLYEYFRRFFGR